MLSLTARLLPVCIVRRLIPCFQTVRCKLYAAWLGFPCAAELLVAVANLTSQGLALWKPFPNIGGARIARLRLLTGPQDSAGACVLGREAVPGQLWIAVLSLVQVTDSGNHAFCMPLGLRDSSWCWDRNTSNMTWMAHPSMYIPPLFFDLI